MDLIGVRRRKKEPGRREPIIPRYTGNGIACGDETPGHPG
jgi:hypothetical protein